MSVSRESAFFEYLKERERVRRRKAADLVALENFEDPQGPPWTDDPVLQQYKFTNVRRHHDKTSMKLRELFYEKHFYEDKASVLMNCALFRYFGTWEFAEAVGWQDYENFDFEGIKEKARQRLIRRERVFTGAYVITNQGISAPKQEVVVDVFLKGLHSWTPTILAEAKASQSWKSVARVMRSIPGFGGTGFMTKEVLIDTTYTGFWKQVQITEEDGRFSWPEDWWEWTPVGPGALRGAARVLGDDLAVPLKEKKAFGVIKNLQFWQESYWPIAEYGQLSPTDIQFGLCEFDKYERVRLGQGKPRSRYKGY